MSASDIDKKKARLEQELIIQRQIAFASGLFQGDITIRTVLESLAEGVVIIDNSGTILLVNRRAEQMFGYPKKDLIGKPHSVLIPERFRKVHEEDRAGFFKEPRIRPMGQLLDLIGRRRDGSEFPVEISLSFIETINGVLVLAFISDITIRKQFESRLRENEELFQGVEDYAIFMLDAKGNVQSWNAGAERIKGYRAEEITGKHFSCFYPEDARAGGSAVNELKKAAAEGRAEVEAWLVRKDGSRFWANVIITALYDESGNVRGFSNVTRDISERKKVEEALRFSEARYRALFRDNPTMIFTLDAGGIILSANPICARHLGYTAEELEGRPGLEVFHEDDRPAVAEQLRRCLQDPDQVYRWQFRKVRKDGGPVWVEETAQAVYDLNGALNILIVCQDITERKRAEDELRKSERKFLKIFHAAPALIGITTLAEGRFIDVNETCVRILGYRREDIIGRTSLELGIWKSREDRDRIVRVLEEQGKVRDLEVSFRGKTGEIFTGLFSAEFIDINGDRYMLSLLNDITDRKLMEKEIERLNADLEARAAELEAANRELEAFNYTVAHDLRRPLTNINGYCQVMQELCSDKLDEQCKGYLRETFDGTLQMNELIDVLLKFSNMAHVELRREKVDISGIAQAVAAELQLVHPERRITFRITDGMTVDGDSNLARVVLDNLLGNAVKYTAMLDEAIIEFGVTDTDGMPTYFVRDNGAGFDMVNAKMLFVPFQRLPGHEGCKGFGIGLATVERIIRRHGGRIWAEGEPGKGAAFYFTLSRGGGSNQA